MRAKTICEFTAEFTAEFTTEFTAHIFVCAHMHEIVKYFILTEIRLEIVNFRSRSDRGNFPRDLAHSRCMEQCMVADLSAGLGIHVVEEKRPPR